MSKRLIIGLAGNPGSGKSTIAHYLADTYGFYYFEGSDYLRQTAKQRAVSLDTRDDYSNFHRQLQKELGETVIADYLLSRPESRVVFAGLRSTQNARKLQSAGGAIIALDAPVEVRFARGKHVGLKQEQTLDAIRAAEEKQYTSSDHLGADLMNTMALADYTLDTSKPFKTTTEEIAKIVESLKR